MNINSQKKTQLIEDNIFKIIIPLNNFSTTQADPQVTPQVKKRDMDVRIKKILKFCKKSKSSKEIPKFIKLKDIKYFRTSILKSFLKKNLLGMTIPEKPKSPKQKYYTKIKLL